MTIPTFQGIGPAIGHATADWPLSLTATASALDASALAGDRLLLIAVGTHAFNILWTFEVDNPEWEATTIGSSTSSSPSMHVRMFTARNVPAAWPVTVRPVRTTAPTEDPYSSTNGGWRIAGIANLRPSAHGTGVGGGVSAGTTTSPAGTFNGNLEGTFLHVAAANNGNNVLALSTANGFTEQANLPAIVGRSLGGNVRIATRTFTTTLAGQSPPIWGQTDTIRTVTTGLVLDTPDPPIVEPGAGAKLFLGSLVAGPGYLA